MTPHHIASLGAAGPAGAVDASDMVAISVGTMAGAACTLGCLVARRRNRRRSWTAMAIGASAGAAMVTNLPLDAAPFSSGAAAAMAGTMPEDDMDMIFFWQPLFSVVLIFSVFGYIRWKQNTAFDAREKRYAKEEELRRLEVARLSGQSLDSGAIEAVWDEIDEFRKLEREATELVAFGEASPTSLRTALEMRLPPDSRETTSPKRKRPQAPALTEDGEQRYVPPEWESNRGVGVIFVALFVAFFVLSWFVLS